MNLGIITSNIIFRESLKSLLENCSLIKDRYVILKEVTSKNIEELDAELNNNFSVNFDNTYKVKERIKGLLDT